MGDRDAGRGRRGEPRDRLTIRRCLALRVAVFFGVLLAIFYREHWETVAVAIAGIAAAIVTYWRNCRAGRKPAAHRERS